MNYHAHVYFKNINDTDHFGRIKEGALSQGLTYHMLANRPVGPHPFPMAEFHFSKAQYEKVKIFFQEVHDQLGLTTLLHIDTGDDLFDHSEGAEWVGPMVDLDFEFFELIKRDPRKRIHK